MKKLQTLGLMLLLATGIMAQTNPDNMFISGYVTDSNGMAVENQEVCVGYVSNTPALPSDTVCITTNSNGYYFVDIVNGSVSGANVEYIISTYDSCSFLLLEQTRINSQGMIDTANVNFSVCDNGGCNLQISLVSAYDSLNNSYTLDAGAGFASYSWTSGETTQSVQVQGSTNEQLVCVTVTDGNGCTAMDCDTLYGVGNINCDVQLDWSPSPTLGEIITAYPSGTAPFIYLWNTGETTQDIVVTDPGTYCVTITDNNGCESTNCHQYSGANQCDVEIITTVNSSNTGLVYTLSASAGFSQYVWSNNATTQAITVQNFNPNGEVYCVSVTDTTGCTASACDTLLPINPNGCSVSITSVQDPNNPFLFLVTAHPSGTAPFTYQWENGTTTQTAPYALNGVILWDACVSVTDANGCVATGCDSLFVDTTTSECEADFYWTADSILNPQHTAVQFTDHSSGNATSWFWDFGDGTTSSDQNPVHTYSGNGPFVACLDITTANQQCQSMYCDTILPPDQNCSVTITADGPLTGGSSVSLTASGNGTAPFSYNWNTGAITPSITVTAAGIYCVEVTDTTGCTTTECIPVGNNSGNCTASFTTSGPTLIGYTFSSDIHSPNWSYYWTIDNQYVGNGYDAQTPGLTEGEHSVCLTIVDSLNNCTDTQCHTITVGPNNCVGYISGEVYAGSNNQPLNDGGVVYLILHDAVNNSLSVADSMVVDSTNHYFFGPLACGDYFIKAAALSESQYYSNHIPTYHGNSPFWGFALPLSLTQGNITADVTLIAANNPGGPGFIGGDVSQGANKADPGDLLDGMQVMLFDLSGNAIAYTYTDANGAFGFSNLAYGTYQVYVEVLGVQTIPAVVTIGPDAPSVEDVHILASESLVSTGIEEFDFDGAISEVYPNPVVDGATINFNLNTKVAVTISVLDLAGRAISAKTVSVASGGNLVRINSENLKNGYYFLNIQDVDGNFSVTRKFMRVD